MKRLANFRKQVIEGWTVQRIAAVLIVVGLVVFVFGAITQYCTCAGWPNLGDVLNHMIGDFYANVSLDCLSVAFAILVIDRLNERREIGLLKAQFIREMNNPDNGIALRAVAELSARSWMRDGSLRKAHLAVANLQGVIMVGCNLQEANLMSANLQRAKIYYVDLWHADMSKATLGGARLIGTNLQEAKVTDQQLITVCKLVHATMPDGRDYDGRFNLSGDIDTVKWHDRNYGDPAVMASYYGVPVEDYLVGQEWAREHLADLRREAGLDPDTGLPVEPTNGVAPQPADAPADAPAPRRNGHKASIVTHRVRRRIRPQSRNNKAL